MIRPLTSEGAVDVLKTRRLGRLGCIVGGAPYVVPINFVFDGGNIYSHSLPGTKIEAMRAEPRACVQVDDIVDDYHWRSTLARGSYEEITDRAARDRVLGMLLSRLPHLTPVEAFHENASIGDAIIVFRIKISEVSGVGEW